MSDEVLAQALNETYLNRISVQGDVLAKALSLDGEAITNLTESRLSAMLYDLARYQVFIQLHANVRSAKHASAKKAFESGFRKALITIEAPIKATIKEKTALAIEENPELQALEDEMAKAEQEDILFKKVPEQTIELVNALKKELTRRSNLR